MNPTLTRCARCDELVNADVNSHCPYCGESVPPRPSFMHKERG